MGAQTILMKEDDIDIPGLLKIIIIIIRTRITTTTTTTTCTTNVTPFFFPFFQNDRKKYSSPIHLQQIYQAARVIFPNKMEYKVLKQNQNPITAKIFSQ